MNEPLYEPLRALQRAQGTAIDMAVAFGPRVLAALLVLAAGIFAGRWLARWIEPALARFEIDPAAQHLIARLAWLCVVGLFGLIALQNLGVELLPLIAGLGVAGAGIALALQGVLGNLAAGLTIVFTRPFRTGDYIAIVGVEGQIESIGLFSTTLLHLDHSKVVVPNRKIVGEILHNHGRMRQLSLSVQLPYDADLAKTVAVVREVLRSNARVRPEPTPVVDVARLGAYALTVQIMPWVAAADYQAAAGEIQQAIVEAFRREGLALPLRELPSSRPQRTG
jgi:small conductance mechanosensitive channel